MASKLYFVDVGTHVGQEFRALMQMGSIEFRAAYIRHRIRVFRKGGTRLRHDEYTKMLRCSERIRRSKSGISCILVEPNRTLFASAPVFREADRAFNIAISANAEPVSLMPLFFSKGDRTGQSSSIFKGKPNVDASDYEYVVNVDAEHFARGVEKIFKAESGTDYQVVLRINNEGAEAEVIKAFRNVFDTRLIAIMGSLMDVAKVKGEAALSALYDYMQNEGIEFIEFHSDIRTWPRAFAYLADRM